jgi:hypothetical protein
MPPMMQYQQALYRPRRKGYQGRSPWLANNPEQSWGFERESQTTQPPALLPQTMITVLLAGSGAAGEARTRLP